ncbi:response regulator [Paenibacillus sp. GCM10027626]|uniref:response regulator transcription factor n=1 Tax=Paenibacillus sp. GCM10027626 TaxID=3273411 RepID=UPI0036256A17
MYSVMLVDDEAVLRNGMRNFIPWQELGFQVVAEAENGIKALERLSQGDIDVVFVDIKMPRMSGIDLLGELVKGEIGVIPIVLSGYENFEYARAAVKFNAAEYLLKPIDMDEVIALLRTIYDRLEQRTRQAEMQGTVRRQILEAMLLKMAGGLAIASQDEEQDGFVRHFAGCRLRIAAAATEPGSGQRVEKWLTTALGAEMTVSVEKRGLGLLLASVFTDHTHQAEIAGDELDPAVEAIVIGPRVSAAEWVKYANAAIHSGYLGRKLFYAAGKVSLLSASLPNEQPVQLEPDMSLWAEIKDGIRRHDPQRIRQPLSDLYFHLQASAAYDPDSIRRVYGGLAKSAADELAASAGRLMIQQHTGSVELTGENERKQLTLIMLHRHTVKYLEDIAEQYAAASKVKTRRIVMEIQQYVNGHLAEPLMLADFADKYAMTQEYLSVLFKKEAGINFFAYLRDARMKRAMEIMKADCTIKVYELAQQVGYTDSRHFSKVFKEATGMTPKQYAESY